MKSSRNGRAVRRTSHKKRLIGLIAAVVTVCIAVGGTIAYLFAKTEPITNTFEMSSVDIDIEENLDGNVKKDVYVKNTSDTPIYVRVRFVTYWETIDTGEIIADVNGENPPLPFDADSDTVPGEIRDDWFRVGDYFYYALPVQPDDSTSKLFDEFPLVIDEKNNRQQVLEVFAEGIQRLPVEAVESVWTDVVVQDSTDNGTLIPSSQAN